MMQKIEQDPERYPYGVLAVGQYRYLAYMPTLEVVFSKPLHRSVIEAAARRLNRHYHGPQGGKASYVRVLVSLFNSNTEAYAAKDITQAEFIEAGKILES